MREIALLFILLLALLQSHFAGAANEWLKGLEMKSCLDSGECLKLQADTAQRAIYNEMYAIKGITLTWHQQKKGSEKSDIVIHGNQGYIDLDMNHVVVRGIENQPFTEMIVSLKSHQVMKF